MRIMEPWSIDDLQSGNWMNDRPLYVDEADEEDYPWELFPVIDDFEVVLQKMNQPNWQGSRYQVFFFSQERGYIIGDSDWYEYNLCKEGFDIPVAWSYTDQGIELLVYEKDNFVYVTESDPDNPEEGIFRWYKVSSEQYRAEWGMAIAACKNFNMTSPMKNERTARRTGDGIAHAIFMRLPPGSRVAGLFVSVESFPRRMYLKVYGWKFNRDQRRKMEARKKENG